jgi:hypothetical protein
MGREIREQQVLVPLGGVPDTAPPDGHEAGPRGSGLALGHHVLLDGFPHQRRDRTLLTASEGVKVRLNRLVDEDGRALHERMISYVC